MISKKQYDKMLKDLNINRSEDGETFAPSDKMIGILNPFGEEIKFGKDNDIIDFLNKHYGIDEKHEFCPICKSKCNKGII